MNLSNEQSKAIEVLQRPETNLLKLNAVAGSGKTHTLRAIADALRPTNGLYLAYNKAIATESKSKFPDSITCMTTHSLAYQNTVKPYKLNIGFFSYRDIKERMPFEDKILVIDTLDKFCTSKYLKVSSYCEDHNISESVAKHVGSYMNKMKSGELTVTHGFYLKYYHMLLASGAIEHEPFDLIMLDESGDVNPVTLEIFKLLPSNKKVMVGDQAQAIYTFNGTINGFKAMSNIGEQLTLSQSFRVHASIAKNIEKFMCEYIDELSVFKGIEHEDMSIKSTAYISRTNGVLIAKIIDCIKTGTAFNLTRPAKSIFELPMILMNLKPSGFISAPQWKFLQDDVNTYYSSSQIQNHYTSALAYIAAEHAFDSSIATACNLLRNNDYNEITNAFKHAKLHEKDKTHALTLGTAHSMKGLEADHVIIAADLNTAIDKLNEKKEDGKTLTKDENAEYLLYYVACSRAIKTIDNAVHLEVYEDYGMSDEEVEQRFNSVISNEIKQLEIDY